MSNSPFLENAGPSPVLLKQTPRYIRLRNAHLALGLAALLLVIHAAVEYFTSEQQLHDALNEKIEIEGPGFARTHGQSFKESFQNKINTHSLTILSLGIVILVFTSLFRRSPVYLTIASFLLYLGYCVAAPWFFARNDETTLLKQLLSSPLWKLAIAVCLLVSVCLTLTRDRKDGLAYRY